MSEERPLRAGLCGIGLDAYWSQFAGLEQRLLGYVERVAARLARPGVEVVNLGLVDTPERSREAGHHCRREDIDVLFLYVTTYALSNTVLPLVQRAGVPVVVLNLQPEAAIDYAAFNRLEDREIDSARLAELHAAVAELTGRPWQAEPAEMLLNVADPLQSRVLLAPLAVSAGGWGQEPVRWQSQQDPGFVRMRQLVEACIKPLPYHDIKGTCGRGSNNGCQCQSCWVRERLEKP